MSGNFWPVFVTVSTISAAAVWKFAPDIGQKLPYPFRDFLHDVVCGRAQVPAPVGDGRSADDASTAAVGSTVGEKAPAANAVRATREPAPVPKTAQNPTGSPYLEPAAQALREYRKLSADFEKRKKNMDIAEQRAAMKKLHAQNQRVEYFNRKHREWKEGFPSRGEGRPLSAAVYFRLRTVRGAAGA